MDKNMVINGITLKHNREFGSYFGTTKPEPYDVGKNYFKPTFRSIYISSEMYSGTDESFFYITSHIHGSMRLYRHKYWNDTEVGNIFASGKTLDEAVAKFTNNLTHLNYNKGGN
jgi:hypothetical protein